jgi:hypothetical protein
MGQYWLPVNLTKKEFIDPHKLGSGLKLWEQIANHPGTGTALLILCANMVERRGGGDLGEHPAVGRWAGDRIAIIGDYALPEDMDDIDPSEIYYQCSEGLYKDVSEMVAEVIERELQLRYTGNGWRDVVYINK